MSAPTKPPRAPRKSLDHRPADVVAAERAANGKRLDVLARIEAQLEAAHGPSWRLAGDAAQALAEPATLRVLLGEPHPAAGPSASYLAELRGAAVDCAEVLELLGENDCTPMDTESLAEAVFRFGRTVPVEAADAVEMLARCQGELADALGCPGALWHPMLDRVEALRVEPARDPEREGLTDLVAVARKLGGAVLLARLIRVAGLTPEVVARGTASGSAERQHLEQLAAYALALVPMVGDEVPF